MSSSRAPQQPPPAAAVHPPSGRKHRPRSVFNSLPTLEQLTQAAASPSFQSPTTMRPGEMSKVIGNYTLQRTIGEGEFGKVKLAVNQDTGERVAMKIINKDKISTPEKEEQLRREFALMKLIDHPHIVKLFEVYCTPTRYYVVLELCPGGELFDQIVQSSYFDEPVARRYFQQFVSAVDYMHQHGVCHRDLKPENLLLDKNGVLKVSDFGFAQHLNAHKNQLLYTAVGTPQYVAPEVIANIKEKFGYDGRASDMWACGVILYVMLIGSFPFDDENNARLFDKILRRPVRFPSDFESEAKGLILRLMEKDPKTRATMDEVKKHPWYRVGLPTEPAVRPVSIPHDLPDVTVLREEAKRVPSVDARAGAARLSVAEQLQSQLAKLRADLAAHDAEQAAAAKAAPMSAVEHELSTLSVDTESDSDASTIRHLDSGVFKRIMRLYQMVGDRMAKQTKFITVAKPDAVIESVTAACTSLSAQIAKKRHGKYRIHAKDQRGKLTVQMEFVEVSPGIWVVDFSRRKGPPLWFIEFYNTLVKQLPMVLELDEKNRTLIDTPSRALRA